MTLEQRGLAWHRSGTAHLMSSSYLRMRPPAPDNHCFALCVTFSLKWGPIRGVTVSLAVTWDFLHPQVAILGRAPLCWFYKACSVEQVPRASHPSENTAVLMIYESFCVYHRAFLLPLRGGSVFAFKESGVNCEVLKTCQPANIVWRSQLRCY